MLQPQCKPGTSQTQNKFVDLIRHYDRYWSTAIYRRRALVLYFCYTVWKNTINDFHLRNARINFYYKFTFLVAWYLRLWASLLHIWKVRVNIYTVFNFGLQHCRLDLLFRFRECLWFFSIPPGKWQARNSSNDLFIPEHVCFISPHWL
jgi:hypothetical protein